MTPKQIASKLLKECDEVHEYFSGVAIPGESSFFVNTEAWKLRSLCAAYLKAVNAMELSMTRTHGYAATFVTQPIKEALREMGES